jgi:NADH-quinone oxidoreductase E subunit
MSLEFSAQARQRIERLLTQYPTAQAALLPVLHLAQDEFGHLPDEALHLVAETLKLPPAHVFGVITFYTMFHRENTGRNELMVCTNVSCMLRGGYDILHHIENRLGIKAGQSTPDGCFHLVEEECLAACANAPMMICGPEYHLDLTPQKVDAILDDLRRRWQERAKQAVPTGGMSGTSSGPVGTKTIMGIGPGSGQKS